jgi:hypothetical protein
MRPNPTVGAEACSKWLAEHVTVKWSPIYLLCEAPGYMWLQGPGRLMALKHVASGVIEMIQESPYAEQDCRRYFIEAP